MSTPTPSENAEVREVIVAVCQHLVHSETELNALDARVGDGDTGSTFAGAAQRLHDSLDDLPLDDTPALLGAISTVLATAMGGSSGVLASVFFAAAGTAAATGGSLVDALDAGLYSIRRYRGADVGDRTLLDALEPALRAMRAGASPSEVAQATHRGATLTASMTSAAAGRSVHVPARHLLGVQNPGAVAIAGVFQAIAAARPTASSPLRA